MIFNRTFPTQKNYFSTNLWTDHFFFCLQKKAVWLLKTTVKWEFITSLLILRILRISKHSQKLKLAHDFYSYCFVCSLVIARASFAIFCCQSPLISMCWMPRCHGFFIIARTKTRCTMFLVAF